MLEQNITAYLANLLKLKTSQINAAIKLIDEGNTIPFIARYRKEVTGDMKDEQLRDLNDKLIYVRNLIKRQNEIKNSIEEQGKMTPELSLAIDKVEKLQELEDIYLPYKQKKRTRAMIAKEKSLEPLAQFILKQEDSSEKLEDIALKYLNDEVTSSDEALAGASDIIAETISDSADIRAKLRQHLWQTSSLSITRDKEADSDEAFLMYEDYTEPIKHLLSHRILAINRGESKDILKVKLISDIDKDIAIITKFILKQNNPYKEFLTNAIIDAYKRLIFPALEREIRNQLTETAQTQAIHVFASNLKQLLLQAPLAGYTVMGLDPGYRTGCKMAIVDATGQVLDHGVLYITMSDDAKAKSAQKLLDYIQKYQVNLISIGNGTASYETEEFVANLINEHKLPVHYLITNEAGASVYSASKLAIEELPEYDVTIRGAISIARRIQDPLAELVKIEPKAIGVGQYQHDVNQKELANTLDAVIEAAVNHVGVELNTASAALLKHIAGINATVAKNIIKYRDEHGIFASRKELLKVSRLGPTAYTQCAGFLRINGATCPLDNTPVHPESYPLAEQILAELGFSLEDLADKNKLDLLKAKIKLVDIDKLATKLNAGVFTVKDILDALTKPGRDPREDLPAPLTRQNIIKLEDIKVGTIMRGTVRNITDFGVFVDIGIKTAGLIHISELSNKHVKHPLDVVSVGDILNVLVISVDTKRNRIGLSLKQVTKEYNNVLA
ncbi:MULTISPECIES: Tex family protein [Megamonas]|uniref:Tex family protein n=1 Tax=Megamonas TaxID=158846 RepID=UPI000E40CDFD|nr:MULTISPECIES: Tex family protein [Megamonas]RGO02130.1 RNA-binding transcriptional accessory protein [Megamonas rupellensis]